MLGASPAQLLRLFIYEATLIGLIGGLIGYLLGLAAARAIGPWLIPGMQIELVWWHPLLAIATAVLCSVLATLYPAIYASRVRVAEAFRAL